ncbi:MAG: TetR family transcriptional regulator C-terminal domain-containing protein [Myxococcales bacterium]|nr:TetR family transcriptional regulator C-terminal domain-containing protein [Myxococcales bacterium]
MARIEDVFRLLYDQQKSAHGAAKHLPGCLIGNLALEMSTQDEPLRQKARDIFDDFARYFSVALSSAAEEGTIAAEDLPLLSQRLVAYLEGVLLLAKAKNDPEVIRQHADGAVALALAGAAKKKSREPQSRARNRRRPTTR